MNQAITLKGTSQVAIRVQTNKSGKIKVRKLDKSRMWTRVLIYSLIAITVYAFVTMNFGTMTLEVALPTFFANLQRIFLQPRLSHRVEWAALIDQLTITLGLAVLGTLIGAVVSFFFALLAARNLSHPKVSQTVRAIMSFIRAIPAILWVLIFALAMGLGSEAAVVGIVFQGIAFLTKAYSETIEEIDHGVIEALKASGATWWQIVFQAVLPSCLTALISWSFLRLETNFGHAVAVGAAAGAGGIGFQLMLSGNMQMDMHEVGVIVYLLLGVSVVFELVSMKLREKLLVKS
ncbi:MAG: ABC transporter permease subunit [Turicibacter sp.]|nr:ABC transporter permease subunit [Turicibacter sp.]